MSTDSNSVDSITRVSTPYELTPLSFDTPYEFPRHFLPAVMEGMPRFRLFFLIKCMTHQTLNTDDSKIPLVLVACGSFSPVTYLHLRMFGNQFFCKSTLGSF